MIKSPLTKSLFLVVIIFLKTSFSTYAQWQPLGNYPDSLVFTDLILTSAVDPSGSIYTAGQFTNSTNQFYVGKWNGSSWTTVGGDTCFNSTITSMVSDGSGNIYVAGYFFNSMGSSYVAKWNGSSWSEVGGSGTSTFGYGIRALAIDGSGNLYAAGEFQNGNSSPYVAKWDGSSWSELGGTNASAFNGIINSLAVGPNGKIYCAGQFVNAQISFYVAQFDGISWSEVGGTDSTSFIQANYNGITALAVDSLNNIYAGGDFVNSFGRHYIAKWDGASWGELGGTGSSPFFQAYFGASSIKLDRSGNVYACGDWTDSSYNPFIAKWDGTSWSQVNGTTNPPSTGSYGYLTFGFDNNGDLFAAGDLRNADGQVAVYKWNGSNWIELPAANPSIIKGSIFVMTKDVNGNLYEAGYDYRDGVSLRKWDGASWTKIGGSFAPFNNTVYALTSDPSGNLYAGGFFTNGFPTGGNAYVAKYDGTTWSELGGSGTSTINAFIRCLASDASGKIYAAGNFTNGPTWPGGNRYVAVWDGSSWDEVGGAGLSTFNNDINSLAVDGSGNLYAAGSFTNASGKYYVAKWDGATWSELGGINNSTFDSVIVSLSVDGSGNVYASGQFTNGIGYKYVAKWNGITWSEVGGINSSTFTTTISKMTADINGNVYVSNGSINTSNNYYVSRWDGSAWDEVGGANTSPFNNYIQCLLTDVSGSIYVGGDFVLSPRSYSTTYVAKYDFISGFDDVQFRDYIRLYPNPVHERFSLNATTEEIGKTYRITDALGRIVKTGIIGSIITDISMNALTAGVYTIAIEGSNRSASKIVKQ